MGTFIAERAVLYTISSHGRPIGVTELAFVRLGGANRSGYFHPTAEGEPLMASIAAPLPAMRAWMMRDFVDEGGRSLVHPRMIGSQIFADLAEAMQHAGSHALALHREDGTLVRTTAIGIQDTEAFREHVSFELARLDDDGTDDADFLGADWTDDLDFIDQSPQCTCGDAALESADDDAELPSWVPEDLFPPAPRYQVHVLVADEADVP